MTRCATTRAALSVAASALVLAAGCPSVERSGTSLPPAVEGDVLLTPLSRANDEKDTRKLLVARLRMITVRLPIGSVSDSEDVWNYVDEEPAGARIGPCLASNGIRVGLGADSVWPDIAKTLRRLAGRSLVRSYPIARPGSPLPIVMKCGQESQTLFTYRRDRTLYGADYPPGDNVLMVTVGIDEDDRSVIHLMCTPLIRSTAKRSRFVRKPGGYVFSSEPTYYPLNDLEFRLSVPQGGFVVIGPGQGVRRTSSPGYHFLVDERTGVRFETLLVIAPEIFAATVRETP